MLVVVPRWKSKVVWKSKVLAEERGFVLVKRGGERAAPIGPIWAASWGWGTTTPTTSANPRMSSHANRLFSKKRSLGRW